MVILNKYRYLTTSGQQFIEWLEELPEFSPTGDPINSETLIILETIDTTSINVSIEEERVKTNEHFNATTLDLVDTTVSGWTYTDFHFKTPISLLGGHILYEDVTVPFDNIKAWIGEKTWADAHPEGPVGFTVGVCNGVSGSVLTVDQTTLENVNPGRYLSLINIANIQDYEHTSMVIDKDIDNMTLTLETPVSGSFTPGLTYVRMNTTLIENFTLIGRGPLPIGSTVTKGNYLPKDSVLRVGYFNSHSVPRSAGIHIEYYF